MGRKRAADNRYRSARRVDKPESLEQKCFRRASIHRAFNQGGHTAKRIRELDRLNREIQQLTEESRAAN